MPQQKTSVFQTRTHRPHKSVQMDFHTCTYAHKSKTAEYICSPKARCTLKCKKKLVPGACTGEETAVQAVVSSIVWAKVGTNAIKRVAALFTTPWLFDRVKRPDDRGDYCLDCSFIP